MIDVLLALLLGHGDRRRFWPRIRFGVGLGDCCFLGSGLVNIQDLSVLVYKVWSTHSCRLPRHGRSPVRNGKMVHGGLVVAVGRGRWLRSGKSRFECRLDDAVVTDVSCLWRLGHSAVGIKRKGSGDGGRSFQCPARMSAERVINSLHTGYSFH